MDVLDDVERQSWFQLLPEFLAFKYFDTALAGSGALGRIGHAGIDQDGAGRALHVDQFDQFLLPGIVQVVGAAVLALHDVARIATTHHQVHAAFAGLAVLFVEAQAALFQQGDDEAGELAPLESAQLLQRDGQLDTGLGEHAVTQADGDQGENGGGNGRAQREYPVGG